MSAGVRSSGAAPLQSQSDTPDSIVPGAPIVTRNVRPRDRIDLRVAEGIAQPGLSDHEGLVGEVDRDERDPQLAAGRYAGRIGPVGTGYGVVVGPGHVLLVLPVLGIDGVVDGEGQPVGRRTHGLEGEQGCDRHGDCECETTARHGTPPLRGVQRCPEH